MAYPQFPQTEKSSLEEKIYSITCHHCRRKTPIKTPNLNNNLILLNPERQQAEFLLSELLAYYSPEQDIYLVHNNLFYHRTCFKKTQHDEVNTFSLYLFLLLFKSNNPRYGDINDLAILVGTDPHSTLRKKICQFIRPASERKEESSLEFTDKEIVKEIYTLPINIIDVEFRGEREAPANARKLSINNESHIVKIAFKLFDSKDIREFNLDDLYKKHVLRINKSIKYENTEFLIFSTVLPLYDLSKAINLAYLKEFVQHQLAEEITHDLNLAEAAITPLIQSNYLQDPNYHKMILTRAPLLFLILQVIGESKAQEAKIANNRFQIMSAKNQELLTFLETLEKLRQLIAKEEPNLLNDEDSSLGKVDTLLARIKTTLQPTECSKEATENLKEAFNELYFFVDEVRVKLNQAKFMPSQALMDRVSTALDVSHREPLPQNIAADYMALINALLSKIEDLKRQPSLYSAQATSSRTSSPEPVTQHNLGRQRSLHPHPQGQTDTDPTERTRLLPEGDDTSLGVVSLPEDPDGSELARYRASSQKWRRAFIVLLLLFIIITALIIAYFLLKDVFHKRLPF